MQPPPPSNIINQNYHSNPHLTQQQQQQQQQPNFTGAAQSYPNINNHQSLGTPQHNSSHLQTPNTSLYPNGGPHMNAPQSGYGLPPPTRTGSVPSSIGYQNNQHTTTTTAPLGFQQQPGSVPQPFQNAPPSHTPNPYQNGPSLVNHTGSVPTPVGYQNGPPQQSNTPVNANQQMGYSTHKPPLSTNSPKSYPNTNTGHPQGSTPQTSPPVTYSGQNAPPLASQMMGSGPPPVPAQQDAPNAVISPTNTNRRKLYPDQMAQAYGATTPSFNNSEQNLYQNSQMMHQPPSNQGGIPPAMHQPPSNQGGIPPQMQPQQFGSTMPSTGLYSNPAQQTYSQPSLSAAGMSGYPNAGGMPPPGMTQLTNGMSAMSMDPNNNVNNMNPNMPPPPTGPFYPGQAPMPGASAQKTKIDPNNIPSSVDVQVADQLAFATVPFRTCSKLMPPLPTTRFTVLDEGIASPRFMRMTTYNIPTTDELLTQSMLPLGCIVQPLAELEAGEAEIELVQSTTAEGGPPRCRRCRAYINPMMVFTQGGRKFICNLCQMENEVPSEYFCNVDMNGRRIDIMQRPELRCGTVEYIAGKEFYNKPPQPIAYVIAIDVSWNAVRSGLLAQLSIIVRDWLYSDGAEQRFPNGGKVAIVTYDNRSVQFYNFHASLDQYQMLVVPDFNDMFVPMSTGFLVDPFESRPVIESFLDALPTLFQDNRVADSVLGAVASSIVNHLIDRGGRLLLFHTCLPVNGPGALKNREDPKLYGSEKEHKLFETAEPFYSTLAKDAVAAGVCIDLFLFPYSYIDVASVGTLSMITGGSTILYPQFQLNRDGAKLHTDVLRSLTRQFGYNALMRVRVSTGLRVVNHLGNFYSKDDVDIELAGIDADRAIAVTLKHDAKLDENLDSVIQVALLYTSVTGQRRIRINTVALTNTSQLGNVFRFAELDTTVNYLAKSSMCAVLSEAIGSVRRLLTEKCVKVLASYRKNCASTTSPGQLILPETFKLFPLCTLALHKSKALRAGDLVSDIRVTAMRELRSAPVSLSVPMLYPRMYALHYDDPNRAGYPLHMRVSYERLEGNGCYLLENSHIAIIWIGRQASMDLIMDVFGVNTLEEIDTRMHVIPQRATEVNSRLQLQIGEIAMRYRRHLSISIVRQGIDQAEMEFLANMIEDKNHDAMSYVDYLVFVHRQIHSEAHSRESITLTARDLAMQYAYGIGASRAH